MKGKEGAICVSVLGLCFAINLTKIRQQAGLKVKHYECFNALPDR